LTPAEFETLSVPEAELLLAARYARLTSVGYTPNSALVTASHFEIDLDLAEQLVCEKQAGFGFSLCTVF
jgi:hypothetical protein